MITTIVTGAVTQPCHKAATVAPYSQLTAEQISL